MCLFENFMNAINKTYSLPLPEVEEHTNQWDAQIKAQANAMPIGEKIWNQEPGHHNISNKAEFDRIYGQAFDGLKVL